MRRISPPPIPKKFRSLVNSMNMKRISIASGVFLVLLLFAGPHQTPKAFADPGGRTAGHGYFTNATAPSFGNSIMVGGIPSSARSEAGFISFIKDRLANGKTREKTGAAFIIQLMRGSPYDHARPTSADITDWEARIKQPDISVSVSTVSYTWDAAYDSGHDDDYFYNGPNLSASALVFKQNGTTVFEIRLACANPIGSLPGITKNVPLTDWNLTGTTTVSATTAEPNATVTFRHTVTNSGPNTAAYAWVIQRNYAGGGWVNATATVNASTVKSGSSPNAIANTITIPAGAAVGSTYCQRVYFTNATGPATAAGTSAAKCVTVVSVPALGCPNLPGVNAAAIGVYSFPTAEPNGSPPGSPSNGYTYFTRPVIGHALVSARDAYTGIGLGVNSAGLTVDFTNAVKAYPYDSQQANVTYTNTYQLYSHTYVYTYTNIYNAVTKKWVLTHTGGYWSTGGGSVLVSAQHSDGQTGMGECYRRGFTVTSVSPGNVFLDNPEDPSQATAGGASATVAFDYNGGPTPTGGMRTPMKIQLSYSWQFDNGCSGSGSFTVFGGGGAGSATGPIPASPSCPASAPPLLAGDQVCITYSVSPETGEMDSSGVPIGGSGSVDSTQACSQAVTNMPYAHFFGLDVSAGGNFANGNDKCLGSAPIIGGITTSFQAAGPPARGSAVQFGALALGTVSNFGSASLRTGLPYARDGLTFANTGVLGNLGNTHCVPDYLSTKLPATPKVLANTLNLGSFSGPGDPAIPQQLWYAAAGGTTIVGNGAGIAKGNRLAIYVTGDAYISKDIKFKDTAWASPDDVPSFYVIVSGNIYIDHDVSQLDGVYIAQNGTINTCVPGLGAAYSSATLFDNCNNQLIVNGSFIASKVNLYRTFASLRNSLGGESPLNPGGGNCNLNTRLGQRSLGLNGDYDCAAEVFNFSPETFLSKPALGPSANVGGIKYDFITSLSPVL